ncbi:hypothetical protein WSK_1241 [Novosphingobium sp. Rr 2-17]|uniref:contact-dependent growth inhibition system immunity protein n=1 Tax=Novosphingobium sp. Rr 2-17 TaxID=555793 RepID=UPI0002697B26|nr:contact-dependent growth inhibition system immunity protein [Novosphingobium sp. Rr 2-17]EIZ80207.1 hypothetical protein WSK_1241 [Novosphingobium sp. Rr 2-17]
MRADPPFRFLTAMMGHCFHQDMDLEAETVPEAVALYVRGLTGEAGRALQTDIENFQQQHADDPDAPFLRAFGDDLDPREVGLSVSDFLRMVEALVDHPASFRQFLEEDLKTEFPQLRHCASACLHLPPMAAEARRLEPSGARSRPHALAIHLGALPWDDKQALLAELQQFEDLYGDRASQVFGKRWLDLEASGFGGFREFRQFAELAAASECQRNGSETIMKRLIAALLLAPLWASVTTTIFAILSPPPNFLEGVNRESWIAMGAIMGGVLGYISVLAVGLPIHKMLQRRDHRSARAYLATWFAGALLIWLIAFIAGFVRDGLTFSASYLAETIVNRPYVPLTFGVVGAVVGGTFWAIVRPDRAPPPAC